MQGVSTPGSAWSLDEAPTHRVERRSAERVSIEVEVSFSSESQFFAGLTGDVSSGTETTTPGVGIAFEALTSAQRASIDEFCKGRAPLYHDVESD